MSQCLFSKIPTLSFMCELNDGFEHVVNLVLSMWLTHHDHQLNAVHDFNFCS